MSTFSFKCSYFWNSPMQKGLKFLKKKHFKFQMLITFVPNQLTTEGGRVSWDASQIFAQGRSGTGSSLPPANILFRQCSSIQICDHLTVSRLLVPVWPFYLRSRKSPASKTCAVVKKLSLMPAIATLLILL